MSPSLSNNLVSRTIDIHATPFRYHTDPSGTFVRYDAKAIGSGSDAAQQSLQDAFHKVSFAFLHLNSRLSLLPANDPDGGAYLGLESVEASDGGEARRKQRAACAGAS